MKTLIFMLTMMMLIVVGWVVSYNYIEDTSVHFIYSLDKVCENIENKNWSSADDNFLKIDKQWTDIKNNLSLLLDHNEIDDINIAMAKISRCIKLKNMDLSLNEIEVLKELFDMIVEKENLTLTNIL